jgi:hypothetical protein
MCIIKVKGGGTLLNPNEKYAYWEDIAEYDLKTAEAMYHQPQARVILEKTREEFLWLKSLKK